MRKFRKAVAAVTVCCLAVSLFTGCHGKKITYLCNTGRI